MTNEELAAKIKAGERERVPELYRQIERLLYRVANRFYNRFSQTCEAAGITCDDLSQAGFFAMLKAVEAFDPQSGYRFTTFLSHHLKNEFQSLAGMRTRVPLNYSKSIDEEVPGADDLSLSDMLPDETAERDFEQAEHRVYNQGLSVSLDRALSLLPEACETLVRERYYSGKTLSQIAEECGVTLQAIRQREQKAFHLLRTGERLRILKAYRDETIDRYAYRSSLSAWKTSGASSTELTAERLERISKGFSFPSKEVRA